jgi:hypothetical protein
MPPFGICEHSDKRRCTVAEALTCESCVKAWAAKLAVEKLTAHNNRSHATTPRVVVLCGSTRFFKEFMLANYNETMAGKVVFSVGVFGGSGIEAHGEHIDLSASDKNMLDIIHKRKIDLSDEVLVINVGGYIGESTRSEIDYAIAHGKNVRYLESQQAVR